MSIAEPNAFGRDGDPTSRRRAQSSVAGRCRKRCEASNSPRGWRLNALTCNVGYRYAPLAILAVALAVVPLASVAIRQERRWGYRRWQLSSLALASASLLCFRLLTFWLVGGQQAALAAGRPDAAWPEALRWAYLGFYVWVGALATLLSANVLSSVHRAFPAEERERGLAGLPLAFALGGLAGSLLASEGAAWLMMRLHWRYETVRDHLMIAMAACFLVQVPVVLAIDRLFPSPCAPRACCEGCCPASARPSARSWPSPFRSCPAWACAPWLSCSSRSWRRGRPPAPY